MKILINAFSAKRGGGQTYLINLLDNPPQREDMEIHILAPLDLELPLNTKMIKRVKTPYDKWLTQPIIRALWEKFCLPLFIQKNDYDVLFCPGGLIGCITPKSCTSITMFRNMLPFDSKMRKKYPWGLFRLKLRLLKRAFVNTYKKADHVIFISKYAKKYLITDLNLKIPSSSTIYHGINESFRRRNMTQTKSDKIPAYEYFLYVSTIDVYKSQIEVVEAYYQLKKRRAIHQKLLLVGPEYGPYASKVRQVIRSLKLESDVLLLGSISYKNLPGLYANATVNIFASQCENCPNILLESMASGAVTLVSECQPNIEFIGDLPIFFNPTKPLTLTDKLEEMLTNPRLRELVSKKLIEKSERYSWQTTANETWETIYKVGSLKKQDFPHKLQEKLAAE